MIMLAAEDFEPWVGRAVRVNTTPEPVDVTLVKVERQGLLHPDFRQPFILYFQSPFDVCLLDATYEFDIGRGGPHMIHISQLQPMGPTRLYQAIFT